MHQEIITKYIGVYEDSTSTINDLPDNVTCGIKLFAHDTKIYSTIYDISYILRLQKDLDIVNEWSHKWLLKFNPDKYPLLQLGPNSSPTNYYLHSPNECSRSVISRVTKEKDLGIRCTSEMKPSLQVQKSVAKAMQALGMIMMKRSSSIYQRTYFNSCTKLQGGDTPIHPVLRSSSSVKVLTY